MSEVREQPTDDQLMGKTKTIRFLKLVVFYCIAFTSLLLTTGAVVAIIWRDADLFDRVVYYAAWIYGGELLASAFLKLVGDKQDPKTQGTLNKTLSD